MRSGDLNTPLATHLAQFTRHGRCHNFHAVPWPAILEAASPEFAQQYRAILGADLSRIDASWSGSAVDSFFTPHGPLADAQQRTARAFGADATFFGTSGTTTSNQIALESLRFPGADVLIDCTAHQSLLFAAEGMNVVSSPCAGTVENPCIDIKETARLLARRASEGRPFDILVLSATNYDGRKLRLDRALPVMVASSPTTAIVIDEAWSALHAFVPSLVDSTALAVASRLPLLAPVLVTHSAHKTMAALRQGSYLHVLGSSSDIEKVRLARYRIHTTSPSWPILTSLDLARAHAEQFGATEFANAVVLKTKLEAMLRQDPVTADILASPSLGPYYELDPLVLCLLVGPRSRIIRDRLLSEYHVLVTVAGDHLVVRLHFGVTEFDLLALMKGLSLLASEFRSPPPTPRPAGPQDFVPAIGSHSRNYIIPYPPGVPLVRPGELWTDRHAKALTQERARGSEIYCLAAGGGGTRRATGAVPVALDPIVSPATEDEPM
ncbi:hypothetical protein J5289_28810 (plasmid) [Rhizobium sp. B230/85]|uniref:hypothetical protein n=1 Tax=unclassified Rhizobium TaxID=2613769 RepID=UPI001ADB97D2|nr:MULTISPECIES: hypothetical protein [unclassified Rhizobium]MBO9136233.1 hypothetical protein [Rhizobium sp. B209b/85]QXZ99919.1 hypothetical protein J5289_28810 [Rhizobium sp. B230/85]